MPKQPRLTAADAERLLLQDDYKWIRSKGSHRIYLKGETRVVIPFHGNRILHPKIVKQVERAIGSS